jgi:hypothetical protein
VAGLETDLNRLNMDSPVHSPSAAFGNQVSPQKFQQSLTEKLKNDLGLSSGNFTASPPKKFESQRNAKAPTKTGVVEFLSGDAPADSSGDWQFGFDSAPVMQADQFQTAQKVSEPLRNEINLGGGMGEINQPRSNATAVLSQYNIHQPPTQPPHLPYQQQQFNRNRNGVNNLPFSDNYSNSFNPDLRSNYGAAPSSPPKTQNVQQPLQNLASQQHQLQSQNQQPPPHYQQMLPPTQMPFANYPYM